MSFGRYDNAVDQQLVARDTRKVGWKRMNIVMRVRSKPGLLRINCYIDQREIWPNVINWCHWHMTGGRILCNNNKNMTYMLLWTAVLDRKIKSFINVTSSVWSLKYIVFLVINYGSNRYQRSSLSSQSTCTTFCMESFLWNLYLYDGLRLLNVSSCKSGKFG